MRYLIHHLLEASARADPEAPAVLDGDRTLCYGALDTRANQLAHVLIELGVQRGDRVALYLDKSPEALLGIYAILKAGAAYVPLDPLAPPARLGYIVADAGVRVLLTERSKESWWPALRAAVPQLEMLLVDQAGGRDPGVDSQPTEPPSVVSIEDDLAYVLYTSGSTGTPKGVMLTHRNCLAFVEWAVQEFAVTAADRLSSHAPLHFDLSTFDLYAAAMAGAPVVLVPPATSVFPSQVRGLIEAQRITVWYSVPSILTMLALRGGVQEGSLPSLRTVLFAGEVFPTRHLRRLMELLPDVRFANLYGPTETNVCTWHDVVRPAPAGDDPIPIGRAIAGVEVFAISDTGGRAEVGEVGELYVRGPTVMQGYLGDPAKTAERLVPDPFGDASAQPVYRTGDLVALQGDGGYRFLGRRDGQIKSRGYRIELGEIEAALHSHPAVVEAAVVAIADELVSHRLLAYVTTREPVPDTELAAFCAERIPAYMIPERFELTDVLPRTSTGKVDRRSLAELAASA